MTFRSKSPTTSQRKDTTTIRRAWQIAARLSVPRLIAFWSDAAVLARLGRGRLAVIRGYRDVAPAASGLFGRWLRGLCDE